MRTASLKHLSVAAAAFAAIGAPAIAGADGHTLRELVEESELVFRGKVQNIQYALSEPGGAEQRQVPHTFVTYRIDELLHGKQPGLTVTLRFIGGLDARSMSFMGASELPEFDLGDEDLLFVRGNTQDLCPLVGNHDGRIRLIGGQAYSETGRALIIDEHGALARGARYRLPEVLSTSVLGREFQRDPGPDALDGPSDAIAAEDLARWIDQIAAPLLPAHAFVNAEYGQPFAGPDMTPAAPPAAVEEARAPDQLDANDVPLPELEIALPEKKK